MTTFSPALISVAPTTTSRCASRRKWITGVAQRVVEPVLCEREAVLEQLHARGHQLFERRHVLGVTHAEDRVGQLEDALVLGARDPEHVADDLERQARRDLADEIALSAERDRTVDDLARLLAHVLFDLRDLTRRES